MIFARAALICHAFASAAQSATAETLPREMDVLSTYPNPFNSSARVQFQLAVAATVQLAIYDTQGRLVTTLVDGALAAGRHQLRFDASGLPSGLYFASLKTGGKQQAVRKLLLVK